jgi:squalene cyclase
MRRTVAREKALAWLSAQPAEEETQYHALRLLLDAGLRRAPDELKPSIEWLRAHQKDDGGWGQSPDMSSDAFATGQAVYALRVAGLAADDPAIQRAREYLTKTQTADGSWLTVSRPTATSTKGTHYLRRHRLGNDGPIPLAAGEVIDADVRPGTKRSI